MRSTADSSERVASATGEHPSNPGKDGGSNPSPRTRPWVEWANKLGRPECPYLIRWLIDVRWFSIRLHHWLSSDDHRAVHDHPWNFVTLVLKGTYLDMSQAGGVDKLKRGSIRFRKATHKHWVWVSPGGCWSLMVTGSAKRKFGFWVNGKYVKANKYFFKYGHHPCEIGEPK